MLLNELLQSVQYVTDSEGRKQAVLLEISTWEQVVNQLQEDEIVLKSGSNPFAQEMAREEAAYRAMHTELLAQYAGKYVAIYHGQLVDSDEDGAALYLRVRKQYPDEFVLITPVQSEVREIYHVYSPQLAEFGSAL
ncbi:MAG: hypothetical protein HF973_02700 [Chloroflexi bacterium]|nr:hypothetical protein [Chloroflexota bacterium]